MSILIVDDVPDNTLLLSTYLKKEGLADTLCLPSATEAFNQLGLTHEGAAVSKVDLILMDVMMPRVNGLEATKKIKEDPRYKDTPIIIVTAKTDIDTLQTAFEVGAIDYILKPVRKVELIARVKSALKLKTEMDQRKQREHDLELALSEIKTLKGLIPICSSCKKIRDQEGAWEQIEIYVQKNSEAHFSHGICEDCMKKKLLRLDERKR